MKRVNTFRMCYKVFKRDSSLNRDGLLVCTKISIGWCVQHFRNKQVSVKKADNIFYIFKFYVKIMGCLFFIGGLLVWRLPTFFALFC